MTVAEFIKKYNIATIEQKLKFKNMWPDTIFRAMNERLESDRESTMEQVKSEVSVPTDDKSFLDMEFETYEKKIGKGGKAYYEFDNGVRFFPNARFGYFATKN